MKLFTKFVRLSAGFALAALTNGAMAGTQFQQEILQHLTKKAPEVKTQASSSSVRSRLIMPQPKIIGGHPAPADEWPYIVSLVQAGFDPSDGHFCGGSLVRPDVVLTAAHCVTGQVPSGFNVYVGSNSLSTPGANGRLISVADIRVHENYDPSFASNDVALVFLNESVNLPVLPSVSAEQMTAINPGEPLAVAGWGITNLDFGVIPDLVQEVQVQYIDQQVCNEAYSSVFGPNFIDETMICAGTFEGGKDSCFGDSGGPLVVDIDGVPHQIGVVSFGNGSCADQGFYGVYARVPYFEQWLAKQLSTQIVDHPLQDPALQACLSEQASTEGWTEIGEVTQLICLEQGVMSLEGLQDYRNLDVLDVAQNPVFDLSPIAQLSGLQVLNIAETEVTNLDKLVRLTQLEIVLLFGLNGIDCIDVNASIYNYDEIADACFALIENTFLEDFALKNCITDTALQNGWLLESEVFGLSCDNYGISSLNGIEAFSNLWIIFMQGNFISDISPLSSLQNLAVLIATDNQISNISALQNLMQLDTLVLWNNQVEDLSPIANLISLTLLDLENNNISDISPLQNLVNLQTIFLAGNNIDCVDTSFPLSYDQIPFECFEPPVQFIDTDGDGWFDFEDNCPTKPNANQKDTDHDGMGNRCDNDDDNDGFSDAEENQVGSNPLNAESTPISILTDWDSDGLVDENDNCPTTANANQKDFDLDGQGDACDTDDDNDGFTDAEENHAGSLPRNPNSTPMTVIIDYDNDGIVDWADNCMTTPNANQKDFDRDGLGDACDADDDNDGFTDAEENNAGSKPKNPMSTPITIIDDADSDGISDSWDNCIGTANPNQNDTDQDGLGNACDKDDDNDGFSDTEENLAGTNPRNPNSFPAS